MTSRRLGLVQLVAILLTALALVPAGAHLFVLPNKIGLDQASYFTVQRIYAGWALFGVVIFAAIVAHLGAAAMLQGERVPRLLAFAAALAMTLGLGTFFVWTYPANVATENWTQVPAEWERLRREWEYSHAVNAALTFVALVCSTLSALLSGPPPRR